MFGWFGKPSKESFAKLVIKAAREIGIVGEIQYQPEEFQLKFGKAVCYLGNAYADYLKNKGNVRTAIVRNLASIFLLTSQKSLSFDEVQGKLFAVVRERVIAATAALNAELQNMEFKTDHASQPLTDWLAEGLVIDYPGCMQHVTLENLREWELSLDEALGLGLENLRDCTEPAFKELQPGVYISTWQDDYDSSRILLPDLAETLSLKGEPVYTTPARNLLLITGSQDIPGLKALLTHTEKLFSEQPRPINPTPILLSKEGLVDFTVAISSPLYNDIQRLRLLTASFYYEGQKEQLEKLYEKKELDYFVANYTVTQNEQTGSFSSYAVWSKGIATILPKSETVMFFDPDKPEKDQLVGNIEWTKVWAELGDKMLDTGHFPVRYYVNTFPSDEQLARLNR